MEHGNKVKDCGCGKRQKKSASQVKVENWIESRTSPFDRILACGTNNTSNKTLNKALDTFEKRIMFYRRHMGYGNFRDTFFPITWTSQMAFDYMDIVTKSGKSTARLYLWGVGEIQRLK